MTIHAALAVGVAFGMPHGASASTVGGADPIEVMTQEDQPVVQTPEVKVEGEHTSAQAAARGTPNPVQVLARSAPLQPATSSGDVVPNPEPTQTPPAHFKMSLSSQTGTTSRNVDGPASFVSETEVIADADVTERARKIGGVAPTYPAEALAQQVELSAPLPFEIVVDTAGHVERARSLSHAGYGLDEAAIAALRTYRFSPATRNGHSVRVRMRWTVDFHFN